MNKRSKTSLIFVAGLGCACSAFAAISQQSYSMKGDLVWSVGTNTVRVPTVILRDGEAIKLTQITEPADPAKYQAAVYLNTPDVAVNFTQFGEDITGNHRRGNSWNNGQVAISNHRMPSSMHLAPFWLMVQAGEEFARSNNQPRLSLFFDFPHLRLHEHPQVLPVTSSEKYWPAGFSQYAERLTNATGAIRQTTFHIQSWTNCGGVTFPRSFAGDLIRPKGQSIHFEFTADQVEELRAPIDTRVPFRSQVIDWRPREDGRLETGCVYDITNGVFYPDIIKARIEHQVKFGPALDSSYSAPQSLAEGAMAPDFAIQDLSGRTLKLSDLRGKVVLLDFWATTCGPCIGEIPALKEAYDAWHKDDRFIMIGVALDDTAVTVKKFIRQKGMPWTQAVLPLGFEDPMSRAYNLHGIPTVIVIGPDGKILGYPGNAFKEYLEPILKQKL